ncbi:MAG: PilZ domain-containing protein [Miltoncostaeaceae bacterium]
MEDRRCEPRISLGLPVVLRTGTSAAAGRTVDVSLGGVQVEMFGALAGSAREVVVEVGLSGREPAMLRASIVRRALSPAGRPLLALRFLPGAPSGPLYTGPALTRTAPPASPAAHGSPAGAIALRQLRALGARLLELALEDGGSPPPPALVTWVGRLAGELGVAAPGDVSTNKALFRGIADMHRLAGARPRSVSEPSRPA